MPKKKSTRKLRPTGASAGQSHLSPVNQAQLLALLGQRGGFQPPVARSSRPKRGAGRREPTYFRVRIDLDGTKPPIWRRLLLGSDLRLDRVHQVIQIAFDWDGHHLHEFSEHGDRWTVERFVPEDQVEDPNETAETAVRLDQVLTRPGDRLHYTYDFGDDWQHTIRLEEILPREADAPRARVLAGRRAAPPDDCGGVYGYEELVAVLADPTHPEHAERAEWFGGYGGRGPAADFDPAALDVEELDEWLSEEFA